MWRRSVLAEPRCSSEYPCYWECDSRQLCKQKPHPVFIRKAHTSLQGIGEWNRNGIETSPRHCVWKWQGEQSFQSDNHILISLICVFITLDEWRPWLWFNILQIYRYLKRQLNGASSNYTGFCDITHGYLYKRSNEWKSEVTGINCLWLTEGRWSFRQGIEECS